MNATIPVDTKTLERIFATLDRLSQDVKEIKEKIFEQEPPYGTAIWWKWSDKKSHEEIEQGDYYELRDEKERNDFFKNILSHTSNEKYHHKIRK